jgi:hypothetical protein
MKWSPTRVGADELVLRAVDREHAAQCLLRASHRVQRVPEDLRVLRAALEAVEVDEASRSDGLEGIERLRLLAPRDDRVRVRRRVLALRPRLVACLLRYLGVEGLHLQQALVVDRLHLLIVLVERGAARAARFCRAGKA